MSDAPEIPPPPPPPMDYASGGASAPPPTDRKRLVQGIVLGVVVGVVLLVGTPIACAAIDAKLNPGELAGLGGLFLGAMIGGGLLLIATGLTLFLPAARRNPLLRGAGRGLLLITGIAALTAGACAVMS